jgi:hypothetical protein
MEVHHHAHTAPPDSHRGKKKWTHYFWEFLMLFLAVFCGFLAEYQLEHKIEKDREIKYMQSMVEDLKSDTTELTLHILQRKERDEMIDSLVYLLTQTDIRENGNSIYYLGRIISPPISFFPNDRTIQQLKSAGGLRLIRNMDISNSIMAYDRKMRQSVFELGDEQQVRGEYRLSANKIFSGQVFHQMMMKKEIERPVGNPVLFSEDKALVNEFVVESQYLEKVNKKQALRAQELVEQARKLIGDIKTQYHLK